jgi:hypothetical protein
MARWTILPKHLEGRVVDEEYTVVPEKIAAPPRKSPKQRTAESMLQRADDPEREARFEKAMKAVAVANVISAAVTKAAKTIKDNYDNPPETTIQQQVVKWFADTYPEIYKTGALFAVPNEGKRTRATASRMKAEGMWADVSDLILLLPRGGFHGACFEMKSAKGRLRPGQKKWLNARILDGYFCEVFFSYEQAVQGIEQYMNLK